jgi:glycosyltransferase involved in cell wall biosynthesis
LQERAELIFVGDDLQKQGAYRLAMENLARELRCSGRFVGFQKNVQEWQMACDIAVVPSHVEPLGTVVLEAMCLGVPVVGCSVGGIREAVVDRRTGLLVPPRSPEALSAALARLIGDAELRRQLGEQGRRRCEDIFSLEAHVGAVVKEYQSVLSSRQEAAVS